MSNNELAKGTVWVLDELYKEDDDPRIEQDLKAAHERALRFIRSFKGKLRTKNPDALTLLSAIREYELIHEIGMNPYLFACLRSASNRLDLSLTQKFQNVQEAWSKIIQMTAFFRLEIMGLPARVIMSIAGLRELSGYNHFLLNLSEWRHYSLSEHEEKIIEQKDLAGRKALRSLYDELIGLLTFPVVIDGEEKEVSTSQLLALLSSPLRSLRDRSLDTLLKNLERHGVVFKNVLNALTFDKHLEDIKRGHPFPMHRFHLSNEVEQSTIEAMLGTVDDHYPLARRYFRLKARLMGVGKIKISDMSAPFKDRAIGIRFSEARQIILEALQNVHPAFYSEAYDLFENRRIDAEVRKGKQLGAFCKCLAPCQHPYISLSYSGSIRDLMTLAHEIGHGIHYRLASKQSYLNFSPTPILAETASSFSEILATRHLMGKKEFQIHKPAILGSHIEGMIMSIFRQEVITRFEQSVYESRQDHLLSEEEICGLWWEENQRLYGEEVEMTPLYRWGWTYIPHIFHRPFYCYSYIFGYLLSIMLFQNYMKSGKTFAEKIIGLFSCGSSRTPMEMIKGLGMDSGKRSIWEQAFGYIDGLIDSLDGT